MSNKDKIIGKCGLCEEEKELCNSHLIPAFLSERFRNQVRENSELIRGRPFSKKEKARDNFILWDSHTPRTVTLQGGVKEHLLCGECEQLLSNRYERIASEHILLGGSKLGICQFGHFFPNPNDIGEFWCGLDYPALKLFLLSVLFRCGVSKTLEAITLGPHANPLREMLLSGDPGPSTKYAVACLKSNIRSSNFMPAEATSVLKQDRYLADWGFYRWFFEFGPNTNAITVKDTCHLQENGELSVLLDEMTTIAFYDRTVEMFEELKQRRQITENGKWLRRKF